MTSNSIFMIATTTLLLFQWLAGAHSFSIQQERWMYKGHPIAYEKVRGSDSEEEGEPILLLNGFGVGSFHQHRLMERLIAQDTNHNRVIYGMDYLGQGQSWPMDCRDGQSQGERGLQYSGDLWIDQTIQFLEQVVLNEAVTPRVHLVGNSVGGHLAVFVAARRPDLVSSVCLLNATPVWGLNLPGWSGSLPAPTLPRLLGRYLFDRMRDSDTVRGFLDTAYFHRDAYGDELVRQIRAATDGPGGHAAFASILWSPPIQADGGFYQCLRDLQCDVLIVFGRDDPWCKPAFAKKMLDALDARHPNTIHRYVELANVGHCPNHEAPQAVASLVHRWLQASEHRKTISLVQGGQQVIQEPWGVITVREMQKEDIPLGIMDRLATALLG